MQNFDIYILARIENDPDTRNSRHVYTQLPSTEASLVQRAIASVRAFIRQPASHEGNDAGVLNTD